MTEQKQIEEMAQIINGSTEIDTVAYYRCMNIAKTIYNAGYRKTFTSDLASDTQKAFKEGYEKGCETCEQSWDNGYNDGYESGKEDGMKEFAEKLKEKALSHCRIINCYELTFIETTIDELLKEDIDEE